MDLGGIEEKQEEKDASSFDVNSVVVTSSVVTKPINDGNISALYLEDDDQPSIQQRWEMIPQEEPEYEPEEVTYDTNITNCDYVEEWQGQTTVPPTCNSIHEFGTFRMFTAQSSASSYYYDDMTFNPSKVGSMKQVWGMTKNQEQTPVIFKTNMLEAQIYTIKEAYADVKDAIIMERTARSKHIMDMYGWCHQSTILQRAEGDLGELEEDAVQKA